MTGPSLSRILEPPRPESDVLVQPPDPEYASLRYQHHTEAQPIAMALPSFNSSSQHDSGAPRTQQAASTAILAESSTQRPSPHQTHGGPNLYACRDCGRSYSRPEHLVRHVQTHTLGRRFTCEICQKSFARRDLLRRHVANHENDSPAKRRKVTSSAGAGRVSQACRPCAAARVKCDDSKPCKRCVNKNLSCVYSEVGPAFNLQHSLTPPIPHVAVHEASVSAAVTPKLESGTSSSPASYGVAQSVLSRPASGTDGSPSKSTPYSQAGSSRPDDGPPLRSKVSPEHVAAEVFAPAEVAACDGVVNMSSSPFFDFLRDVLYEQPMNHSKIPESQEGMPMLGFCDNANLDLTDVDFGLLDHWNLDGMADWSLPVQDFDSRQDSAVDMNEMRRKLVKVWTESPWRWDPKANDSGYRDQGYFVVPSQETSSAQFQRSRDNLARVSSEKMDQSGRDRVMAILLSQCREPAATDRVASSFPTVDVLDTLIHTFLAAHSCQVDSWIHFPTFALKKQWPEWMAMAAAHGGAMIPIPTLRRFGMAVMEAVRITIPARFEERNTAIQTASLVQALVLVQDLGLWSGNRRRMEIAECHLVIPVTMMRYRGRFQRTKYPLMHVEASDEGEVLQQKWRSWVEREQWKRLVFHCHLREAQISMTTLTNPCLSYSELTLPLPEARELWFARSAEEWKREYMARNAGQLKRPPSLADLLHDVHLLTQSHARLDVQFSVYILLCGFWAMILEYRQLSSVHKCRTHTNSLGANHGLLLNSRHQQLVKDLQSFQLMAGEWEAMSAREHLLFHLLMMNLHVSIDDVQLFLGKEGEDQARRVYPTLQQWITSSEARSAVWHASQVLHHAQHFPPGHLKDFHAVAVHHAAITLWTFGVVTQANRREYLSSLYGAAVVYLDGADLLAVDRFIEFERGRPLIKGPATPGAAGAQEVPLHDPRACMDAAQAILRANFIMQGLKGIPPIVENLIQLIEQLGSAAWAVGLA